MPFRTSQYPRCTPQPSLNLEILEDRTLLDAGLPGFVASEPSPTAELAWTPNDQLFSSQWHLNNTGQGGGIAGADIHATQAWSVVTMARRVTVAVLDTGIDYTHPDLYQNIWINQAEIPASRLKNLVDVYREGFLSMRALNHPTNQGVGKIRDLNGNGYIDAGDLLRPMIKDANGNDTGQGGWADGVDQERNGYVDDLVGWNFVTNTNNPFDDHGHGSHVAGLIGATGNNGTGVAGVAWNVQLVALKMFDSQGRGYMNGFVAGLDYSIAKGIRLANCSWMDTTYLPSSADAVARAQKAGILLVVAAGNQARNTDTSPVYPAGYKSDNILSVAATDNRDQLASFSNFGTKSVAIAAPGVGIVSTNSWGRYGTRSGTSMAAPQVAGAAALVWALRPEWTHQQMINWLKQTATRLSSLTGKVASGRLDLAAAVRVPPRTSTSSLASVSSTPLASNKVSPSSTVVLSQTTTAPRLANVNSPIPVQVPLVMPGTASFLVTGLLSPGWQYRLGKPLWV